MTNTVFTHNLKVYNQAEAFGKEHIIPILEWITSTFFPDDIYPKDQLEDYCRNNSKVSDVYDDDTIVRYVVVNLNPDEVFPTEKLQKWAEDNGYIKEE
jgi:hypothetical protein